MFVEQFSRWESLRVLESSDAVASLECSDWSGINVTTAEALKTRKIMQEEEEDQK
jgi:hypothetical protein